MQTASTRPGTSIEYTIDANPALRDRVSQKQLQIIEAATPLFMEHGFHETSVRMIADAAELSMGSLYQYIHTKEDILYLAAMHTMAEIEPVIMRQVDPVRDIRSQIASLLSDYITVLDRNRKVFKMVYRETASLNEETRPKLMAAESRLTEVFVEHVEAGIKSGEIQPCNAQITGLNLLMFAHTWSLKGWWLKNYVNIVLYREAQVANALRMIPFQEPPPR
jgi:AcrR family transcriptional regulator